MSRSWKQSEMANEYGAGMYVWFGFLMPFEDRLRLIRESGFKSICTWFGNEFSHINGDFRDQTHLADRYGLKVEHAHIPYYRANDLWADTLDGQALFDSYKKDIDNASRFGPELLTLHPYEKMSDEIADEALCVGRLKRLTDFALAKGVRIGLENLKETRVTAELLKKIDNPAMGLCFDAGHHHIADKENFDILEEFGGRLFSLHLHDNDGLSDKHLLPFEGTADWPRFMAALQRTAYRGTLMLESCNPFKKEIADLRAVEEQPPYPEAAAFTARAFQACRRLERLNLE